MPEEGFSVAEVCLRIHFVEALSFEGFEFADEKLVVLEQVANYQWLKSFEVLSIL